MASLSNLSRVRDLIMENSEISPPGSPTKLFDSDSSESFMYLSSEEPTRSDLSQAVGPEDDLSLDQIHFLLEKARQLKQGNVGADKEDKATNVISDTQNQQHTSPSHNFNFKPRLNLLERQSKTLANSPLSQSTPLISQLLNSDNIIQSNKGGVRQIFQKGYTGMNIQKTHTGLSESKESINHNAETINNAAKTRENYPEDETAKYISPDTTPSHSFAENPDAYSSNKNGTQNAVEELKKLKLFLSKSEQGAILLEGFESGLLTPPMTSHFTRSASSTPIPATLSRTSIISSSNSPTKPLNELVEEIDDLNSKLREADKLVNNYIEEKNILDKQITEKDIAIDDLTKELKAKTALVNSLNGKVPEAQEENEKKLNGFLEAVIGDEKTSIDREFLKSNGCEHLYDTLNLSKIDQLTFIELQNCLKEIAIALQTDYNHLDKVIFIVTKFFKEDYLRLILFLKGVHSLLYSDSKMNLPEIYKLNWIASNDFDGLDDQFEKEYFDKCLNQMLISIKAMRTSIDQKT